MQSIQALLDDFTLTLRASRVSENTISAYLSDLNMFFAWLSFNTADNSSQDFAKTDAMALLGTLDQITLRHWMASCTDPKLGNKKTISLVRALSAIKKLVRFATKVEPYAKNCPDLEWLLLLKAPKIGKRVARALEHVSINELLSENPTSNTSSDSSKNPASDWQAARDRALFTLLYASGMRLGEALNLSCAEIELPMITVRGKGRKERRIPMLPIIKETFDQYRDVCPFSKSPQAPAFVSSRGLRLGARAVQRRCENKRVQLNLGNDFTPHALRRAFASHLLADGANLRVIQELLGHSSLSTTEKYTAIDESTLVDELRALHPRDQM